ncbi:hypothetical protein JCM3765_000455 [Sporobolomyces pararoseus]
MDDEEYAPSDSEPEKTWTLYEAHRFLSWFGKFSTKLYIYADCFADDQQTELPPLSYALPFFPDCLPRTTFQSSLCFEQSDLGSARIKTANIELWSPERPTISNHTLLYTFCVTIDDLEYSPDRKYRSLTEAAMSTWLDAAVSLASKFPDMSLRWREKEQSEEERAKTDSDFGGKLRWQRIYSALNMNSYLRKAVVSAIDVTVTYLESTFIPEIYRWERFMFIDDLRHDRSALVEDPSILQWAADHGLDFRGNRKIAPLPKTHLRSITELETELQKCKEEVETLRLAQEKERLDLIKKFEQEKEGLVSKAELERVQEDAGRAKEESELLKQDIAKLKEQQSRISVEEQDELQEKLKESQTEQKRLEEESERSKVELEELREEVRRLKDELGTRSVPELDTVSEAATESSSLEPLLDCDSTDPSLPAMQLHDIVEELANKHQCKEFTIKGPSSPGFHDHEPRFDFELEIEGHLKHHCYHSKGVLQGAKRVVLGAAMTLINKKPELWKEWLKEKEAQEESSKGDSEEAKQLRWESLCEMVKIEGKLRHEAGLSCDRMVKYLDSNFIPEIYGHERFHFRDNIRRDQEAITEWNFFEKVLIEHGEQLRLSRDLHESSTTSNLSRVKVEEMEQEHENELAQLKEELKQSRDESAQAKKDFTVLRHKLDDMKEQSKCAREALEQSEREVDKLKNEQNKRNNEEIKLRTKSEQLEEHLDIAKKDLERLREELVESRLEARRVRDELAQKSRQLLECREANTASSSVSPLFDADSTPSSLVSMQLQNVTEELARFKLRLETLEAREPV